MVSNCVWLEEKISKLRAQIREYYLKKIIGFYNGFSSEKELLKDLISNELDLQKAAEDQKIILQKKKSYNL